MRSGLETAAKPDTFPVISVKFYRMKHLNIIFALLLTVVTAGSLHAQKKIVLTTYNSQITDVAIASIGPDDNWGKEPNIWPYCWTQNGIINITRPLIRFDFTEIPSGAKVLEALLILHYDPTTHWFGYHSGNTDFYVRRILEPWDELTATWNNQPATTTQHQLYVPPASFNQQNYVLNVTDMVSDMLSADSPGNFGFMMSLEDEFPYNSVRIASADHADLSRRPQLWLTIDYGLTDSHDDNLKSEADHFTVGPNPTSGELAVSSKTVPKGTNAAELYDMQGKLVLSQTLAGSFSYLYLNQLAAGVYVLKIFNDVQGYVQEEKIVVAR